ncbi:MAG: hypothetical protein KatS3mg002_1519 [Candidatus Woesearchaeota archaeon]|nr:MAG: hypothetical protein KatS3mg002_1519 [Candidatus Woesearchaeota archaeon]
MTKDNYGIFVMYVLLLKFAASISMPFFALYLLKDLKLGYVYFTIIIAISIVTSFFAMSIWGKIIDKHGSKKVLEISGILVPFSPLLLIIAVFINNPTWLFIFLVLEEMFAGIAWSAFNLSTSSFLFDATNKDDRVKSIAYYNFLVGIGVFLGAMLGGLLTKIYPVFITSNIPLILLTSGVLRLLVTLLLIRKVREARMVEIDFPGRGFFHSAISINPRFGSNIEIIGVYHDNKHQDFHRIIPKRKPVDPVKKEERGFYERKSLELYRDNALKTLIKNAENKDKKDAYFESSQRDDSYEIEKNIELDKKRISELAEEIKKKSIKK